MSTNEDLIGTLTELLAELERRDMYENTAVREAADRDSQSTRLGRRALRLAQPAPAQQAIDAGRAIVQEAAHYDH